MQRSIWMTGSIIALVLLLGGAALVGKRLQNGRGPAPNAETALLDSGDKGLAVETYLDPLKASALPQAPRDVEGVFVRREDNSIFVGTGNLIYRATQNPDGELEKSINYDGTVIEIVRTHDTVIYRDVTSTGGVQTVEPGSLDEIGAQTVLTVWGQRRGDRVVAQVLVYRNPGDF